MRAISESLETEMNVTATPDGGLMVEENSTRVYLHQHEDPEAKDQILLFVDYSDIHLVKRVVSFVADLPDVIVDNDFGAVMTGHLFVERMDADPDWDWREA